MALLALVWPGGALAHTTTPLKTFTAQMGPYPVLVSYYSEPRGGQALAFTVVPTAADALPASYHITAVPGSAVDAVATTAHLQPDPDSVGVQGTVNLPVSGQWFLEIDGEGSFGPGTANVPILAGAPPALPNWLGWLIGLVPLACILTLIGLEARRATRARPALAAQ